jgi:hypothetical protein
MTPTDRLSDFGTGLATNSDSVERVPRGQCSQYSNPNGSAHASFFRSLATETLYKCDAGVFDPEQPSLGSSWNSPVAGWLKSA